jgi:hypothetical protein
MKLSQALKVKNRLAGEVARLNQVLHRENSRRNDNTSKVDRQATWVQIMQTSDELGVLKGKIATANVGIYSKLERMGELKARIAFINSLPKRDGEEVVPLHGDREPLTYNWDAYINQEGADSLVGGLQKQIEFLQDEVDAYNATTEI